MVRVPALDIQVSVRNPTATCMLEDKHDVSENALYVIKQNHIQQVKHTDSHYLQTFPNIMNFGMDESYTLMIMCMESHWYRSTNFLIRDENHF